MRERVRETSYLKSMRMVPKARTRVRMSMHHPPSPRRRWAAGRVSIRNHLKCEGFSCTALSLAYLFNAGLLLVDISRRCNSGRFSIQNHKGYSFTALSLANPFHTGLSLASQIHTSLSLIDQSAHSQSKFVN